jgi:hypothetical protein
MHKVSGHYYSFSTGPDGALSVQSYAGEFGTFGAGPGGRSLTNFAIKGSLEAKHWAVAAGGDVKDGSPVEAASCQLPVGDYLPEYLTLQFGHLRIQLSQNYHSEGKRQSREGRPNVYGITVRKDQPYALDFSNHPEVMFTSPTNSQRIKPGEQLMVMAVLTDPKLDIMIRRLEDTSHQENGGNVLLDPKVIITRANGEKVAEGVMPFG